MNTPKDVVSLLQELIRIPSVNPDGLPGTDQIGEKACAEYVGQYLEASGAEVTLEEILPDRPNVIGRFPSKPAAEKKPCILFGPHTDTVGVAGMSIDPFGGEIRDDRIWGRGASDTKGSMAAMLQALHDHRDLIPDLPVEVMFVGFMSEESSQHGSREFAKRHGDDIDFALIGEPTEMDVVFTHKACCWVEVTTTGKAAHGSRPELGDNAVLKMAPILLDLEKTLKPQINAYTHDVLGPSTMSINMCHGGNRANVVPDHCVASLDIRATPDLYEAGVLETVERFLQEGGYPDVSARLTGSAPTLYTDPSDPFIQKLAGLGSGLTDAPWFCDAGWLSQAGIPSIAIGPGSIDQAHTKDEFLAIKDLEEGAEFFGRFLRSLAT